MREKSIQEKLKAYFEGTSLGLPSFEFYRNLDRHFFNYNDINKNFLISLNERNEYKNLCEDINSDNKNSWYKRLCVVLLMVLKTTGTKISKKDNDYDDCKLLNYWI
ncbi:variable surface protein, partial [Plasmodium gonderi]